MNRSKSITVYKDDNMARNDLIPKYNSVVEQLALDWPTIQKLTDIDISVEDYDRALQSDWYMPKEYKQMIWYFLIKAKFLS